MHQHPGSADLPAQIILSLPFALALLLYACGVGVQIARGRRWPWTRTLCWSVGVAGVWAVWVGGWAPPGIAGVAHMWQHLVIGMAAPVALVCAAPITLALRTLHVSRARRLARLMRTLPVRIVSAPVVAAALNVGGLLYVTPLHELMNRNLVVHALVTAHLLIAGVLFTAAVIPVDPAPHRASPVLRIAVLIGALAAHGILAKLLYARPPDGTDTASWQAGAQVMFYGGDMIDGVIIAILCAQWYRSTGRRMSRRARMTPGTA